MTPIATRIRAYLDRMDSLHGDGWDIHTCNPNCQNPSHMLADALAEIERLTEIDNALTVMVREHEVAVSEIDSKQRELTLLRDELERERFQHSETEKHREQYARQLAVLRAPHD